MASNLSHPLSADDQACYARGLALWRAGSRGAALAEWERLSDAGAASLAPWLDRARRARLADLLVSGHFGECLEMLDTLGQREVPEASHLRFVASVAAMRAGQPRLAARAAAGLRGSWASAGETLMALLAPADAARTRRLAERARDARVPDRLRAAAMRVAAASLALDGRLDEALALLPGDLHDSDTAVLRWLLRHVSSGGADRPRGGDCDWIALRSACAEDPALVDTLAGDPDVSDPESQAAYWLARADLPRALSVLAEAQRRTPWSGPLARNLAALAYIAAARRAPEVDVERWRDCIAQTCAVLQNPRWVRGWVLSRLAVYTVPDDEVGRAEELRPAVEQRLNQRLTALATGADMLGDTVAAHRARMLQADLAREMKAADAMRRLGELKAPDGIPLAFGPLFAERAGVLPLVGELFDRLGETDDRSPSDALRHLLASIGMGDDLAARLLSSDDEGPLRELRRWFSELGEAVSLRAAGQAAAARDAALAVYARWSPPHDADPHAFAAANPGYAGLEDGPARLRREAAALVCETRLAVFREDLARSEFDVSRVARELREIIAEAAAFGREAENRYELTRIVLGKRKSLLEAGDLEAVRRACSLLRLAAAAGLDGLDQARVATLRHCADLLITDKRYGSAADCYEEAWGLDRNDPTVAVNTVALHLHHYERLRQDRRDREAEAVHQRAEAIAADALRVFPDRAEAKALGPTIQAVCHGMPVAEVFTLAAQGQASAAGDPGALGADVIAALSACRDARAAGDAQSAWQHAERARSLAPTHPDVMVVAVQAALELARTLPMAERPGHLEIAERALAAAAARFPRHRRVRIARWLIDRNRVLFAADGPVTTLRRKALRLLEEGRAAAAAELLRVVFALSPTREPDVCALLAECLAAEVGATTSLDAAAISERVATAEKLLALGRELDPEHPGVEAARARLDAVRRQRRMDQGQR